MLSVFARFLFTSTAIAPVALVYAYALWAAGKHGLALSILGAGFALIAVSAFFLMYVFNTFASSTIRLTAAETADQENVAFLLLYVSPLFTASIDTVNFSVAVPSLILFLIVIMSGNTYHFNPLLNILGWHFYKVDTEDAVSRILVSRRSLRNVVNDVEVVQLTDYVVLERSRR